MTGRRPLAIAGCLALFTATVGCPGTLNDASAFEDGGDGDGDGGTCPDIPEFLGATCTGSGCHSSSSMAQGLDLQSPDVASRLVGIAATEGPGLLIDPSSPSDSVLYLKLTANPPFGVRMPLGGTPLDASTLACVLAWITQEASSADAAATSIADASNDDGDDVSIADASNDDGDAASIADDASNGDGEAE
jgi:hypothetical protein